MTLFKEVNTQQHNSDSTGELVALDPKNTINRIIRGL